jgi:dTDP-glucose 4,6-dehydratase
LRTLISGGSGFIGSNFVRYLLNQRPNLHIVNLDKLTYASNPESLQDVASNPHYTFVRGDITDRSVVEEVFKQGVDALVNFAAETHVDRSVEDASPFLRTNILGTQTLLEVTRRYAVRRFVHISTDEVYGSTPKGESFTEEANLDPGSPYAASKAAADHFVSAYANTYGIPTVVLRCTNNYGPYQFPEKLIPLVIANAREAKPVPIYGDGLQERDWLYVEDYCRAIDLVLQDGRPGTTYNVSAGEPQPNINVVRSILALLKKPESLITYVDDRPGHDRRYAIDSSKVRRELGWAPQVSFEDGIRRTVAWYESNSAWLEHARSGEYAKYYERHYLERSETFGRSRTRII